MYIFSHVSEIDLKSYFIKSNQNLKKIKLNEILNES